ncbi:MAG TPA: glycine--tRNA ligase subunit beta [Candidatus Desulfofervidus auxilii]|uniref:Glycine--tRNA ligase beta subunit n=1 Tax=Desulfofervidus auxilii TaxID=1621989 RepID=A0A7V0IAH9_DESA2|nr:glycine--tRNA ligase subunit beta [Candidatus Desulfofervidus auxilii]
MKKTLILEIGTEELPISIFPDVLTEMKRVFSKLIKAEGLEFNEIKTMATPRRLTLLATGIPDKQLEKEIDVIGPPYKIAFDDKDRPTKAAYGFAKKYNVSIDALIKIETKKGEYVGLKIKESGKPTLEILASLLPKYILSLSFPKSMRWYKYKIHFVRPIHWILALFDGKMIPFSLEDINSSNITFGHRFIAPQPIVVSHPKDYEPFLEKAFVIVDHLKRQNLIINLLKQAAKELNGKVIMDKDLLNWVNFLTEYPVSIIGNFDKEFLFLPEPVLITVLKQHQKCFAVKDNNDHLLPVFIAIINTPIKDFNLVRNGLERVVKARLSDARFFYEEDLKIPLSQRISKLNGIIFQERLGTVLEKVKRLKLLVSSLTETICPKKKKIILRAASLCKADLTTEMVNEFPELQGIMGGIYAREQGERKEVVKAISEHYLPIEAGGKLPETLEGAILAIADKIDTIVGCFGVGLIPTGTADPYALRRLAIGILRILLERNISLSLFELVQLSLNTYGRFDKKIKEEVLIFLKTRLFSLLQEKGYPYHIIEAVISVFDGDVPKTYKKAEALYAFSKTDKFEPLVIAYKRVYRILETEVNKPINVNIFTMPQEKALYEKYLDLSEDIKDLIEKENFYKALHMLVILKPFIDDFFDHVLVMTEDNSLRENRLALLTQLKSLFLKIADLGKIPI